MKTNDEYRLLEQQLADAYIEIKRLHACIESRDKVICTNQTSINRNTVKSAEKTRLINELKKQVLALRVWVQFAANHVKPTCTKLYDDLMEALAATDDLSGLVLCDAEPIAWRNKCSHGWYVYSPSKLDDEQEPIYKARNP